MIKIKRDYSATFYLLNDALDTFLLKVIFASEIFYQKKKKKKTDGNRSQTTGLRLHQRQDK